MYQALYRKYRPKTFSDVVGQQHITDTLRRQVAEGRLSHAYLFTGTRGTGKTTCAKILSKAVNCLHPVDGDPCNQCEACRGLDSGSIMEVTEIDAASNNGVDSVRALRDEAVYSPASIRKRVYIIDEVHMLSTPAFNALLKILEEPPEHLMFILATTELHKVPATIKSRCQQFSFKRLLPDQIAQRLMFVSQQEGIDLTEDGARLLSRLADGGMRDALSLLDQCRVAAQRVDEEAITMSLGMAGNLETARLLTELARGEGADALTHFARLYGAGKDVRTMLGELSTLVRDLLLRKTAPRGGNALLVGGYDDATMRALSELLTAPRLIQMLTLLQATIADLPRSGNQRTDGELCLIRLSDETLDGSAVGLSARVARLETMMSYPAAPVQTQPKPQPKISVEDPAPAPSSGTKPDPVPTPTRVPPASTPDEPQKPLKSFREDPWANPASTPASPPVYPPISTPQEAPPWEDEAPPPWETEPPEEPQTLGAQGFADFTPSMRPANPQPHATPTPQPPQPVAAQGFAGFEPPSRAVSSQPYAPVVQPSQPVAAQGFAGDDTFWSALVPMLKPLLSPAVWPFVSNPAMTVGHLRENSLELEAKVSVTKAMIDKPEVLSIISQAAQTRLGYPVEVRVSAPAPAVGRMDDLLEFGRNLNQDS